MYIMTDEMLNNKRAKRILSLCFQYEHLLPKEVQDEVIRFKNNEVLKASKGLWDLEFSVRAYNIIIATKCETIADLLDLGEEGLLRFRNCGRKTVNEIKKILMDEGFTLPMKSHTRQYEVEETDEDETSQEEDKRKSDFDTVADEMIACSEQLRELSKKMKGGGFINGVHYTNPNFILRCASDSMYATIRKVENEHRTQCTNLLDGHCNAECKNYSKCWWRQLRSVADDYETVRKGKLNNGEAK